MSNEQALRALANPFLWALIYMAYRVCFTNPGRPPSVEDLTHE